MLYLKDFDENSFLKDFYGKLIPLRADAFLMIVLLCSFLHIAQINLIIIIIIIIIGFTEKWGKLFGIVIFYCTSIVFT